MTGKLRYLTSGESHGCALLCIIDGMPSGLSILKSDINRDLSRRQKGYGRSGRMKIESDSVQILSGVRWGKTIGSPITLLIENRDWVNWKEVMSPELRMRSSVRKDARRSVLTRPRPGHADLSGALKYGHRDLRNVLERSSARETAARVAVGAVAKKFLSEFNIKVMSSVVEIGGIHIQNSERRAQDTDINSFLSMFKRAEASPVRCPDKKAEKKIINKINNAIKQGNSLGGVFEIVITGVPAGLGSYSQWDRRLNARFAYALMGIQAIKGVEVGLGFEISRKYGSEVMDKIFYRKPKKTQTAGGFYRRTNNAGGIEGGISNGMPIALRAAMKPIPTLKSPLSSVDIISKKSFKAVYERSDVCAVASASVIGEAVTAFVTADSFLEKFGGDSMDETKRNYEGYLKQMKEF
ncbi:MAG: chorismate synthase [Thermodesulfovibrionia bacterium]|nr:chorismate synthase [Thermodesulfovibrionia bacterium]